MFQPSFWQCRISQPSTSSVWCACNCIHTYTIIFTHWISFHSICLTKTVLAGSLMLAAHTRIINNYDSYTILIIPCTYTIYDDGWNRIVWCYKKTYGYNMEVSKSGDKPQIHPKLNNCIVFKPMVLPIPSNLQVFGIGRAAFWNFSPATTSRFSTCWMWKCGSPTWMEPSKMAIEPGFMVI